MVICNAWLNKETSSRNVGNFIKNYFPSFIHSFWFASFLHHSSLISPPSLPMRGDETGISSTGWGEGVMHSDYDVSLDMGIKEIK